MSIMELMIAVFLINLPFGYWRFNAPRFSRQWLMAVHIPVPFIFLLRILSGLGWKIIPLLILSDIAGQFAGERLRRLH